MSPAWSAAGVAMMLAAGVLGCTDHFFVMPDAGACASGLIDCDGECVNPLISASHCGACGTACDPALACIDGACRAPCADGLTLCAAGCTDLAIDSRNCGRCGIECRPGLVCVAGACAVACGTNLIRCGDRCVDPANDPTSCGGCDRACGSGATCSAGKCVVACGPGTTPCGDLCKDLSLDPNNCGACGRACAAGLVCSGGDCALSCGGGTGRCGDRCVDTTVDPAHCGGCGLACAPGQLCAGATCSTCPPGRFPCRGACVDVATDAANCGSCGVACPYVPGGVAVCSSGVCAAQCSQGYADCDQSGWACETYLAGDRNNCGACGVTCPANAQCSSGTCQSCSPGKTWCDWYCADTATDPSNCGGCGKSCAYGGYNTERTCSGGVCGSRCYAGYVDCDGDPANGCEVYVASNWENCGTCGIACGPHETCVSGACRGCAAGRTACNNSCVDLTSDSSHCGACDRTCASYLPHATVACVASVCTPTCTAGYLDCDANAANGCETSIGRTDCGACGVTCGGAQFCSKAFVCTDCSPTDLGSTVPQTVTGTTIGKPDRFDCACGFGNAPDVYFSFTAPADGSYTFDTSGSAFDAVLEVRTGGCDGPLLACNDDGGGASAARVTVALTAGQIIVIILDGKAGGQGTYTLHTS